MEYTGDIKEGEIPIPKEDTVVCPDSDITEIFNGEISHDSDLVITEGEVVHWSEPKSDEDKLYGDEIYSYVEQMPEYPGGEAALIKYIRKNLRYPGDANGCPQGRVVVQFYIDTLGHVCAPRVYRGIGPAFDEEALRVVRLLPDFIPGEHDGKKVNVWYTLPVSFKLPDIEPVL